MINLFLRPNFKHKNVLMLSVEIGKYSIPFEYFLTLDRIATSDGTTFNFYYYEKVFKEFLLDKNYIILDNTDSDGVEFFKFKKYDKFKKLTETIINLFELNREELQVDYRSAKIEVITNS